MWLELSLKRYDEFTVLPHRVKVSDCIPISIIYDKNISSTSSIFSICKMLGSFSWLASSGTVLGQSCFLISFYRFIVLSFFFGKKHIVYSIVLSFYRCKENIEFFLSFYRFTVFSFYRCKPIVLSL